jgi:hypothetical protein
VSVPLVFFNTAVTLMLSVVLLPTLYVPWISKLGKVVFPLSVPVPANTTLLLLPLLNVPLFDQLPYTFNVPLLVRVAPDAMATFAALTVPLITGLLAVLAMMMLVLAVGTVPLLQLAGLFHAVETVPVHVSVIVRYKVVKLSQPAAFRLSNV